MWNQTIMHILEIKEIQFHLYLEKLMKKRAPFIVTLAIVAGINVNAQTNIGGITAPPAGVNLEVSKSGTTKLDSLPTGVSSDKILTVDTGGNVRKIPISLLGSTTNLAVNADDVFAGIATPLRKDDVLYNIIDPKTGGMVTYKKVTLNANGQAIANSNVDSVLVRKMGSEYFMLTKDRLTAKDFGAKGDGTTDDYVSLQKAINTVCAWGRTLYIPAGQYLFSHTLNIPNVTYVPNTINPTYNYWFTPKIVGDGENSTELKHIGTNDTTCIQALQGDGNAGAQGGLYDLMITGDANSTTALYINGRGGFQTYHCKFVNHKTAIFLHNSYAGDFTEFVVQHDAFFTGCKTVISYFVSGGGDASFHGSGIDGGTAVVTDNYPIKIYGGNVYNAPLTLTFFLSNSSKPITVINNYGAAVSNFYGHLSFENTNPSTDPSTYNIIQDGNFLVTYVGTISSWQPILPGMLRQTNAFASGYGGFPALSSPIQRTIKFTYPASSTNVSQRLTWGDNTTGVQLVFASCISQGVFCQFLLAVSDAQSWGGNAKVISTFSNTLPTGYNVPTFGYYDGWLTMYGTKTDGSAWDQAVQVQYNILPMTDALTTQSDPQH